MFQIKLTVVALAAVFLLAGQANALADNDVDACNGDNHYDLGHSCAFKGPQGKSEGTCQKSNSSDPDSSAVLICQTS
ncbi:hypothetical protein IW261DRAFT_838448 [Armillaria novae-zelandiae]|uniref:Uncharacterized protein n=1 Tax=Armillaria novae-zelandiae TaxID=153914 RepID=A0AA39PHP1_9AGAR|nr:hypothetical protein IW261DRAFT_838448 [Armillaria novae-zelandiae]